eukprot:gnl/MRDRNA2_/MRDRNA2_103246_c0_seq1.p1 gnl/MRDRNA2_/MRDRNA2_103246_c0~~gnl/MRDRNA2_/MRDRNA2_103246_c0_seq1.p1  ORF type:complete len:240 (+),score=42.12 gnl/MRDRNA2_/MRDRNA2_103246_c0_seq1:99-722(+)
MASASSAHARLGGPAAMARPEPPGPHQRFLTRYAEQHGGTAAAPRRATSNEPMRSIEWCLAREQLPLPKRPGTYETSSGMFRSFSLTEMANAQPAPDNCGSPNAGFGFLGFNPAGKGWGATTSATAHGHVNTGKLMRDGIISGGKSASVMVIVEKERDVQNSKRKALFAHTSTYQNTIGQDKQQRRPLVIPSSQAPERNKIDRFFGN